MVLLAMLALAAGLLLGHFGAGFPLWDLLLHSQDGVLNLLMLSVGVSIGLQRGIWQAEHQPLRNLLDSINIKHLMAIWSNQAKRCFLRGFMRLQF